MKYTRYADLTNAQRDAIVEAFDEWVAMPGIEVGQAVSIAAKDGLGMTAAQWNSRTGEDAFAAALGVLVMKGAITIKSTATGAEQQPNHAARERYGVRVDIRSEGAWNEGVFLYVPAAVAADPTAETSQRPLKKAVAAWCDDHGFEWDVWRLCD